MILEAVADLAVIGRDVRGGCVVYTQTDCVDNVHILCKDNESVWYCMVALGW